MQMRIIGKEWQRKCITVTMAREIIEKKCRFSLPALQLELKNNTDKEYIVKSSKMEVQGLRYANLCSLFTELSIHKYDLCSLFTEPSTHKYDLCSLFTEPSTYIDNLVE